MGADEPTARSDDASAHGDDAEHDGRRDAEATDNVAADSAGSERESTRRALTRTSLFTVLGAVFPGAGLLAAGRRVAGGIILGVFLAALLTLGILALTDRSFLVSTLLNPTHLTTLAVCLIIVAVVWVAIIVITHLALRGRRPQNIQRVVGAVVVTIMAFLVAAPLGVGARYSYDSATLVSTVFHTQKKSKSATRPTAHPTSKANPWEGIPRVNILLLGGDSDNGKRLGVRTDTVMVASIDTKTGDTTLIGLPRNTARMPFPKDSPLHKYYPNGFTNGDGNNAQYFLNAMYGQLPNEVPKDVLGPTDNLGADALKISVGDALGLKIDYYVLIDIKGFQELIDALGGITVNINTKVAVGGSTDHHVPPKRWLHPGPNQHLDGYDAMWFARGRYGADDFQRMDRQRCVINAIIKQANPANVLSRYEAIARASKMLAITDIPQERLPALVDLSLKVKNHGNLRSLVFKHGVNGFSSPDPDWKLVRSQVKKSIGEAKKAKPSPSKTSTSSSKPSSSTKASSKPSSTSSKDQTSEDLTAACQYHPE